MTKLLIFVASVATIASVALAHEGHKHATGVVRERMESMTDMGERLLAISKRLRANKDLGAIADDARVIQELASKMAAQYPAGSSQFPTAAKPVIWQEWADFSAKAKMLEAETEKLRTTDPSDGQALRAQFRAVGYSCDGCHEIYRTTK